MSNRTRDASRVEDDAAALIKALAISLKGNAVDRAFTALDADAAVKGHAWRAIRHVLNYQSIVLWQRTASPAAIQAMLARAAAFADKPRHANPSTLEYLSRADRWVDARKLKDLHGNVEQYLAARLRGVPHSKLTKYNLRPAPAPAPAP